MLKQQYHHSIHFDEKTEALAQEGMREHRSLNAYLKHCVVLERKLATPRPAGQSDLIAEAARVLGRLLQQQPIVPPTQATGPSIST